MGHPSLLILGIGRTVSFLLHKTVYYHFLNFVRSMGYSSPWQLTLSLIADVEIHPLPVVPPPLATFKENDTK